MDRLRRLAMLALSFGSFIVVWHVVSTYVVSPHLIRVVHDLLDPVIEFFRFLSPTAMIPIAVIWFGIGETSKYFLIFWGTFFIVLINAIHGVMATPWARVRAAECLGATQAQIFAL